MKKLLFFYALATVALHSCQYKDLEDDYGCSAPKNAAVNIDFAWDKIDSIPASYRVIFYPSDEETAAKLHDGYMLFDIRNTSSTLYNIPTGNYNVTAYSTDTEHNVVGNIYMRDSLYATSQRMNVVTTSVNNVVDSIYHTPVVYETPDYVTHANINGVHIDNDSSNMITLHPDSMVVAIHYAIHGIRGLNVATQVSAVMDSVFAKRYIAYPVNVTDTAAVLFDCDIKEKENTVSGTVYAYGLIPVRHHKLTLLFYLGQKRAFLPIDISEQLKHYSLKDRRVDIVVDNADIDLRKYVYTEGVFDVNVNDWEDINIDISW